MTSILSATTQLELKYTDLYMEIDTTIAWHKEEN